MLRAVENEEPDRRARQAHRAVFEEAAQDEQDGEALVVAADAVPVDDLIFEDVVAEIGGTIALGLLDGGLF